MKTFIIKSILLLFSLFVLDRVVAFVLEKFFYKQYHGDDYVSIQLFDSTQADILILGSSRASHHYIPDTITKYTSHSVYNGGRDNMGIHYIYSALNIVSKRYKPQYVILDLIPHAFLKGNQDQEHYFATQIATLLPFAQKHSSIYEDVKKLNPREYYISKLSKAYAYNGLLGTIAQNAFTHFGHTQEKGYEPLSGSIDSATYTKAIFPYPATDISIDSTAFQYLEKCIALCLKNNMKPILCFSPNYFPSPSYAALMQHFETIVQKHHIALFDFSHNEQFTLHPLWFYDELHLNHAGASVYSKILIDRNVFP
ncbi:MAG: hypothetical protein R2831_01540 [Chitinophagaceae bacterium]